MTGNCNTKNINSHFTAETKMISRVQELKLFCCQSLPLFLPLILSLFFLYKWLYKKPTFKRKLPPCPPRLPILGNLHQLGSYPHRSLRSLSEKYGDLMLIYSGTLQILIVSSAKAAREIMKTHDVIFSDRPLTKTGNKLLYNGKDVAGAKYGEYWRQMKSICVLHLLSTKRVRSFRSVREEEMVLMMEKIEKSISLSVNLTEILMSFTNDVICRVAFGRKYGGKEGGNDFMKMLREFLETLGAFRVGDFIPWLGWTNWISGWDAKVDRIAKEFDCFLEEVVREHEDLPLSVDGQGKYEHGMDNEKVNDIVDVLLEVQKDATVGFRIDRDSIKALIMDMFSGGTDTTYSVLEWAMTELLRHPTVMHELQKEVREIAGEKNYVNEDDIEKMKYLKAVIKETLRLHPPVPLLAPRLSTQEAKINGYDIPEKTAVLINAWAIHRDPAFWDEPEKFNPGRFVNDMFSGGTDTTYTVLEWAMTELLRHPTVLHVLQKEVREITGEKQYVNEDDLEKMNYLKAVIKETLRLHPPIPLLVPRLSTQEAEINGYDIPEKTAVIINSWAIHRDPAFWDEAEKFNPGRFVNSRTDFRGKDFQLIPFGGGRRICPGILFATANNELALANLVNKFNWTLPDGAKPESLDTDECTGDTIHRKTPLFAVAVPHTC